MNCPFQVRGGKRRIALAQARGLVSSNEHRHVERLTELHLIATEQSASERLKHRLEYRLMFNDYRHAEFLIGDIRCRRCSTEHKLTNIEHSFEPGETVSSTARRYGVAPNLRSGGQALE